jgi:amino acid transporter
VPGAPASTRPALVRAIGRGDLTAAVVNGVIGSGIFGMPAALAALTGAASPLAFLLAGAGVATIVLCFAEVASRFREAGGPYLYAREAFGPFVGFQAGWLTFWVRVTALAANLNVFVDYLAELAPLAGAGPPRAAVMIALVAFLTAVNLIGVREATWTVNLFTVAKLAPLTLLAVLGLVRLSPEVLATQAPPAPDWTQALLLLMFAYGGFEAPLIPAGEARDPRRDSAFSLLVALGVIALAYMLVQLAIVGVVPHVAGERAPVAAAFSVLLGPAGVALASLAAMISVYGYSTGNVLQSPRVLYAIADRGELPAVLARVHPRFRTPHVAIAAFAAFSLGFAVAGTFTGTATLSAVVRLITYGLTCVALPVLRRRGGDAPFRLPGAAVFVVLGVGFCLWLLVSRLRSEAWTLAVLAALVALGAALWAASGRGRSAAAPAV